MERGAGFSSSGSSQARIASMRQGSFAWMTKQGRIDYPQHTFITKRVGIYEVLSEDLIQWVWIMYSYFIRRGADKCFQAAYSGL